jgi:hypothetical protein
MVVIFLTHVIKVLCPCKMPVLKMIAKSHCVKTMPCNALAYRQMLCSSVCVGGQVYVQNAFIFFLTFFLSGTIAFYSC